MMASALSLRGGTSLRGRVRNTCNNGGSRSSILRSAAANGALNNQEVAPENGVLSSKTDTVPVEEENEESGVSAVTGGLEEVFHYNFHEKLSEAGDKLVVLDFFTDKCGPCKLIYPKVCELADEYSGEVHFFLLNCNKYNKPLAKELNVKSVPTFKVFHKGVCLDTMTGARIDELRNMIEQHRLSLSS